MIAIDPKGDMGNLMLTFPDLAARDFEPWINTRQASDGYMSSSEFASVRAELWKAGIASWGHDIARAKEIAHKVRADLEALNADLENEFYALETAFDAQTETLEEMPVKPKTTDIHIGFVGLAWMPYRRDTASRLTPAWPA